MRSSNTNTSTKSSASRNNQPSVFHVVTYIVVTILAAAANIFSATLDFIRYKPILINMAKVGVSESWITTLGILKAAGALGLVIGIGVPAVGIAAAAGFAPRGLIQHGNRRSNSL